MKHLLVRTEHVPGEPARYLALCGYESGEKKDFAVTLAKVTCEACHE